MTLYFDKLGNIICGLKRIINLDEEYASINIAFRLIEKLLLLPRFIVPEEIQKELLK
jgi:hypothetical protein